jgi:hypothetical protein
LYWTSRIPGSIALSALRGGEEGPRPMGQEALIERVRAASVGEVRELDVTVELSDARTVHVIENRAEVLSREYGEGTVTMRVNIGARQIEHLRARGARMEVRTLDGELVSAPRHPEELGWKSDDDGRDAW